MPNPAKAAAQADVGDARGDLSAAHAGISAAIADAAARARRPGSGGSATVDPTAGDTLTGAQARLAGAQQTSRATPTHLPLAQVRPGSRLLETERKLLTHAIRMSAYNTESTLARLLRPHYARGQDEARALLREAFTLTGDLQITGDTLHVRLDPATAPRRSKALAALCADLTATATRYPGTELTLAYSVKGPPRPCMNQLTMSGVLDSDLHHPPDRKTFRLASRRDWDRLKRDVKLIYTAPNEATARAGWTTWPTTGAPATRRSFCCGRTRGPSSSAFLDYDPPDPHRDLSTNAIESLNARYRRAIKARGHSPTEQAATKCLYLLTRSLDPTGKGQARRTMRWKPALNAFATTFPDRWPAAETYR